GLSDRWKEFNIQHQDPQQPFGSLRLKGNEVKVAEGNNLGNLRNYRFWNSSVDGKAYAYTDELTPGMKSITPESDRLAYNALSELFAKYFHIVDIGVNPSNVNATNPRHYPTVNDPTTFSTLNRSFPNPLPLDTANVTQAGRTTLRAPQVYSINPIRCQNQNDPNEIRSNAHEVCTVGERNNITVSDRNSVRSDYNGDGRIDEDTDGDGQVDPIVETGSYTAVVKFFAYADDNRMPIRRVMVDWNDGSMISNEGKKGLYKNRKPYCESSDDPSVKADTGYKYTGDLSLCINTTTNLPTGLTCKKQGDCGQGERCDLLNPGEGLCMTVPGAFDPLAYTSERCTRDSDCSNGGKCRIEEKDVYARVGRTDEYQIARFGDLPRACMPNYFQFVHSYTCGVYELEKSGVAVRSLNPIAKSKVNGLGYADDQKVCVFKPRVQVMDNWEWCNGNCGPNGCYKSQCDPADTEFDPWVYYGGQIIVLPFNRR
ncbi:MAG TPA: hypothetical protein VEA18_03305, partial [Candidatus Kapabacteria bacterium]|nr:hypothetical protein [Candidatus Kapabacteria bacterium]